MSKLNRGTLLSRSRPSAPVRQERLRFADFSFERTQAGRVSCRVVLDYGGQAIEGTASGTASPAGDLRLGAEAAIRALETFTERGVTFELIGVKVVRAFDSNVIIAALTQHGDDGPERLVGCFLTEADQVRGAAMAVLNATNRVLGNYILTR